MADRYACTLGEALGAVVLAGAIPRMRDSLLRSGQRPDEQRYPDVPARLLHLIWDELPDDFEVGRLLRHPDARRAGDRQALLQHVRRLVRGGDLRRERRFMDPRTREYRIRTLYAGPDRRNRQEGPRVGIPRPGAGVGPATIGGSARRLLGGGGRTRAQNRCFNRTRSRAGGDMRCRNRA